MYMYHKLLDINHVQFMAENKLRTRTKSFTTNLFAFITKYHTEKNKETFSSHNLFSFFSPLYVIVRNADII